MDLAKRTGFKVATKVTEKGADEASKQASHAIGELIKSWLD